MDERERFERWWDKTMGDKMKGSKYLARNVWLAAPDDEEWRKMLEHLDGLGTFGIACKDEPCPICAATKALILSAPSTPQKGPNAPNVGQPKSDAVSRGKDDIPGKEEK